MSGAKRPAQIARVLRAIGERKAALQTTGELVLASPKGNVWADAASVTSMVSEGLLERVRGTVSRTDAGRAFLRRVLSANPDEAHLDQHREPVARLVKTPDGTVSVTANAAESPLAWLAQRKDRSGAPMISAVQHAAGERLASDHDRGNARPSVTASWDATGVRGTARRDGLSVGEAAEDARRRVKRAFEAVGPGLDVVLAAVCCEGLGLDQVEKRFGWPARSAKVVLRLALDRLALHYGLAERAQGPGRLPTVHWGAADYRPRA